MLTPSFWQNKRVLVTGHTGFKGAWISYWLHLMGATVKGIALPPPTKPNLFEALNLSEFIQSDLLDIRDFSALDRSISEFQPEVLLHLAAQPLVRYSYREPLETYAVNVMGTAHVLESCRKVPSLKSIVIITTDKCYENKEWVWGYRETDPMGGYDPYSSSKGCAELVTAAYRRSFYAHTPEVGLASTRAGNVIGGGDWAEDRLVPDLIRAFSRGEVVHVRHPRSTRPWQHVLEPLGGYLLLAEKLYSDPQRFSSGYNFGPLDHDCVDVETLVRQLSAAWGEEASFNIDGGNHPHEAQFLKLDISKARQELGWAPRWGLNRNLTEVARWYRHFYDQNSSVESMRSLTKEQIANFVESPML